MNKQLKERLAYVIDAAFAGDWRGNQPQQREESRRAASLVMGELRTAGYVVVKADRWGRVRMGAEHMRSMCLSKHDGWMCVFPEILEADFDPRTELD